MIGRAARFVVRRGVKLSLFAAALLLGGVIAYAVFTETVTGSGKSVTVKREIGNVTEVVIDRGDRVEILQGDVPSLSVTADDNLLPLLETRTRKGKLTFEVKSGFSINAVTPISYTVKLPKLEKLSISGAGNVETTGLKGDELTIKVSGAGNAKLKDLDCKTLNLTVSGAGITNVTGRVEKVVIRLSGAGDIDALGLKAATTEANISGAGNVKVWATNELKANISGAGSIQYKGDPKIQQSISGAGSVKKIGG
jgi:hypothetical protein